MVDDQLMARALRGSSSTHRVPSGQVLALYERLCETGELGRYLVVEYRCGDTAACVLARVFTTPTGTFIHKPACGAPGAATPGALSGPRGWPETAYLLPTFPIAVSLGCGHLWARWEADAVRADIALAHRRGAPTGRRVPGSTSIG